MGNKILITGTAGFIGFHLVNKLVKEDYEIVGLDNINDYYDVNLKYARLKETGIEKEKIKYNSFTQSSIHPNYRFIKLDLTDKENILKLFKAEGFEYVVNLAAQAGVRYSLMNPQAYIDSNITGFLNILEGCRNYPVKHLVFASSSSVYGLNKKMPLSTSDNVDHPVSLYAATKKSNELMAHAYSYLYNIPVTGLRFFTVYGPWGRPDMALFIFTKKILAGEPIDVYNNGDMIRDFTYIDDIVEGVNRIIKVIPANNKEWDAFYAEPSTSSARYELYNIGNSNPVKLMDFISALENILNKKAEINYLPMQPGDVKATNSDVKKLFEKIEYKPDTSVEQGIKLFIKWFLDIYKSTL